MSGELDDKVFALDSTLELTANDVVVSAASQDTLPLCMLENEYAETASGRWVKEPWPTDCPKFQIDQQFNSKFDIVQWTPDQPHCWHRDDLTKIGHKCVEMNCRLIHPSSKWTSDLRTRQWMGVWRNRQCDLLEFTDTQLQTCIDKLRIAKFQTSGRSISEYINQYLQQRIKGLHLYNDTNTGAVVELSTLALLHKSNMGNDELRATLAKLPLSTDKYTVYVVSPMFLASERETLAIHENMVRVDTIAREVLEPMGYKFFSVTNATIPLVYDVSTQFDGMHMIGPPMKLILTKFFHYLCSGHVEGTRM